jgi:hypothetical protein
VHAEIAAPAHRTRGVDLHDGLGSDCGIGRETDGGTARAAPVAARPGLDAIDVGEREEDRRNQ